MKHNQAQASTSILGIEVPMKEFRFFQAMCFGGEKNDDTGCGGG